MKNSGYYKSYAKECLSGNWGAAILVSIVSVVASSLLGLIPVVGTILSLLIAGQIAVGALRYYTKLIRKEDAKFSNMFEDFHKFLSSFAVYLLQFLLIILWFFLFIIPGIIAIYSYSMAFFLKNKHPEMRAFNILQLSKKIMQGRKWELFCLELSFFGWILVGIITFGIGFFYVGPYMQAATTKFFEDAYNEYNNIDDNIEV